MKNLTVFLYFLLVVNAPTQDSSISKQCQVYQQLMQKEQTMNCRLDSLNVILDSLDYKFMLIEQYLLNTKDTL